MNTLIFITIIAILQDGGQVGIDYAYEGTRPLYHQSQPSQAGVQCRDLVAATYSSVKGHLMLAGEPVADRVVDVLYQCREET